MDLILWPVEMLAVASATGQPLLAIIPSYATYSIYQSTGRPVVSYIAGGAVFIGTVMVYLGILFRRAGGGSEELKPK